MKDQYFGDRNDYFKYDLVIFFAEQLIGIKRFTFIPMLTANDGGGDGGITKYRQGAGRPDLYRFLQEKVRKGQRRISYLREYFSSNGLQFRYCPHGDSLDREFTNEDRDAYFRSVPNRDLKKAVILLDPDNGVEVKSATDRTWQKYVKFAEVKDLYHRMDKSSILSLYQHLPHSHRRTFLYSLHGRLKELLKYPLPYSVSDSMIAFILIAKDKKRQKELREALADYMRTNLQLYD